MKAKIRLSAFKTITLLVRIFLISVLSLKWECGTSFLLFPERDLLTISWFSTTNLGVFILFIHQAFQGCKIKTFFKTINLFQNCINSEDCDVAFVPVTLCSARTHYYCRCFLRFLRFLRSENLKIFKA